MKLDYKQLDDLSIDGIDMSDAPDFCDAYITSGTYQGRDLTDTELDALNEDRDFVYEKVMARLY